MASYIWLTKNNGDKLQVRLRTTPLHHPKTAGWLHWETRLRHHGYSNRPPFPNQSSRSWLVIHPGYSSRRTNHQRQTRERGEGVEHGMHLLALGRNKPLDEERLLEAYSVPPYCTEYCTSTGKVKDSLGYSSPYLLYRTVAASLLAICWKCSRKGE